MAGHIHTIADVIGAAINISLPLKGHMVLFNGFAYTANVPRYICFKLIDGKKNGNNLEGVWRNKKMDIKNFALNGDDSNRMSRQISRQDSNGDLKLNFVGRSRRFGPDQKLCYGEAFEI